MQVKMRMRTVIQSVLVLALASACASCGDVVRQGRSPSMLVVNSLAGAPGGGAATFAGTLLSNVAVPLSDPGQVSLGIAMKDITVAPTSNNQVTVTRYTVTYRRNDGKNTPGVDVPYPFDGAVTGTVTPAGTTLLTFELVRQAAKATGPLVQLVSSSNIITTIADVTFYGTDQVGNDVSVTGSMVIEFGNFGGQ
jgi:hypothetical protein